MPPSKLLPFWILTPVLISALAVITLGFHFSKEEKVVSVNQDREPLSNFAGKLISEVESLEKLYIKRLIDLRDRMGDGTSSLEIVSICREMIGLEQATIIRNGESPVHLDLRERDRSVPLTRPRLVGESPWESSDDSEIIIDVENFELNTLGAAFQWLEPPGHPPHFLTRLGSDSYLVLRINPDEAASPANEWIESWLSDNFAPVLASGLFASLEDPSGNVIAASDGVPLENEPNFILPVNSIFGTWKVCSWAKTETITSYRLPIMIGSAVLSITLILAGMFGFTLQSRALLLAEQRVSFVNRVSHELRTPMTNILLNVDLLSDSNSLSEARKQKRLGLIRDEALRLSRLLENVLSFSQRERGKADNEMPNQSLRISACNLNELIGKVLSQFSTTLERKNIAVSHSDVDDSVSVLADPDAFCQIVGNLFSNVEKYAASGGMCRIDTAVDPSREEITIAVSDMGPGVPRAESSRIFRPFARLNESTSEGVSGTGLGLAIARDLAESMNGSLEIDVSKTDETTGARFILTLPLAGQNIVRIAS